MDFTGYLQRETTEPAGVSFSAFPNCGTLIHLSYRLIKSSLPVLLGRSDGAREQQDMQRISCLGKEHPFFEAIRRRLIVSNNHSAKQILNYQLSLVEDLTCFDPLLPTDKSVLHDLESLSNPVTSRSHAIVHRRRPATKLKGRKT